MSSAAGAGGGGRGGANGGLKLKVPGAASDRGVLVPEGWKRTVVKHKPSGGASGGPGSSSKGGRDSSGGDRDTFYKSPCGKTLRSKDEVTKYLGSNPACAASLKDFHFETSSMDLPPARLLAPVTPSPTASGDGAGAGGSGGRSMMGPGRKSATGGSAAQSSKGGACSSASKGVKAKALKVVVGGKGKAGVAKKSQKIGDGGAGAKKKGNGDSVSPKTPAESVGGLTPKTPAARGTGGGGGGGARDSLGGFLSPLSFGLSLAGEAAASRVSARISVKSTGGHTRGVRAFLRDSLRGAVTAATGSDVGGVSGGGGGKGAALSPTKKAPMSRSERASAQPVELETFKRWKAGGLLEVGLYKLNSGHTA
jgi:hypothetical protein